MANDNQNEATVKHLTLRLPKLIHVRLRRIAEHQGRSLNKMIIIALEFYLKNWEYYND